MHEATDNLEAWRCFVTALNLFERFTKEDNAKAQELFEQAVQLDPAYAAAWTHWNDASFGFSRSRAESFKRAVELAQKALELDDANPDVHALLGGIYLFQGQHEQAISEGKSAIALRPNRLQPRTLGSEPVLCRKVRGGNSADEEGHAAQSLPS
jgi:tetratricopeptide (TPR) repeat protein